MMDTVTMYTRDGRPVCYPTLTPVDSSRQITTYLSMTALGRHVLRNRAEADGRRVAPTIPPGMTLSRRNALLEQTAAGRSLLAREAGR